MTQSKAPPLPVVLCACGRPMDPETHLCTGCGRTVAQAGELAALVIALRPGDGTKH